MWKEAGKVVAMIPCATGTTTPPTLSAKSLTSSSFFLYKFVNEVFDLSIGVDGQEVLTFVALFSFRFPSSSFSSSNPTPLTSKRINQLKLESEEKCDAHIHDIQSSIHLLELTYHGVDVFGVDRAT